MSTAPATGLLPGRASTIAALERTLGWLATLEDGAHRLVCPDHRLEHTGKSACAAILALELFRATGRRAHLDFAVRQGRRLVARLEREGTSPCHTFRPGRHDPFNCSNSVIDGGACADALASLCLAVPHELAADDAAAFRHAALLHTDTYLKYACRDKGIPAQRAWALTGLASAHALAPNDEWRAAALEAMDLIAGVQRGDGSHPYHPLAWGAEHAGSADASSFYESRVTGFQSFAAERLGFDTNAEPFAGRARRALEFVDALIGPDGHKCGVVEAKPWYWGATSEVVSNVFDAHALASGARAFGRPEFLIAARRALAAWSAHLLPDGRPQSHTPGPGRGDSYQCALFWASHACWAARALEFLPEGDDVDEQKSAPRVRWFADTQLARFDTGALSVFVRGARPPGSALHGSPVGNGIVRAVRANDGNVRAGGAVVLDRCRLSAHEAGEWNGAHGRFEALRGWRAGGDDLRFSVWLARVAWRRGERLGALALPLRHLERDVLAFGSARVSSAFCRDVEARFDGDELVLAGALARRDGTAVAGTRLERGFALADGALRVDERLFGAETVRDLSWSAPRAARDVERDGSRARYRLA
jgi:hypothetical protein